MSNTAPAPTNVTPLPAPTPTAEANDQKKIDADFKRLLDKEWHPTNGVFQDPARFAHAQRVATMLCASALAPEVFRGTQNLGSAVIAVDMAFRLNMNPLMVMQQLYVVHGKPGWSAQFVIAVINASGKFSPIRFKFTGEDDTRQCVAYSKDLASGEILEGTPVSIALAKKEGWFQKTGSKWQSMAEQMLAYRSASFWGRIYAPEMFMGLPTADEIEDMTQFDVPVPTPPAPKTKPKMDGGEPEVPKPVGAVKPTVEMPPNPPPTEPVVSTPEKKPKKVKEEPAATTATPPPTPTPEPNTQPADTTAPEPPPQPERDPREKLDDELIKMGVSTTDFNKWVSIGRWKDVFAADQIQAAAKLLGDEKSLRQLKTIYGKSDDE